MPEPEYSPLGHPKNKGCHPVCCVFCAVLILAVALWGVLPWVIGQGMAYDAFLKPNGPFEYTQDGLDPTTLPNHIWWPGCVKIGSKTQDYLDQCAPPCFSPSLIPTITSFSSTETFPTGRMNGKAGRSPLDPASFRQVNYSSRPDMFGKTVMLRGWLLPGDNNHAAYTPARIVIQHGFTSNSNKWAPTLMAYYLRSLGFDVLINNLRDHGYSDNSSDITTWGYEYHYDLLGAWDYLRADPESILSPSSHPVPSAKVGILGVSMGAFIALNAFTNDSRVPAVWADSPPARPKEAFSFGFENGEGIQSYLAKIPGVVDLIWYWLTKKAPVDIETRYPLKDLVTSPVGLQGPRPMQIAMNRPDKTVSFSGVEKIVEIVRKYPGKYNLTEPYYTDDVCNKEDHIVSGLLQPEAYRQKLCTFWTNVFDIPEAFCELDNLPTFNVTARRRALMASAKDTDVNDVIV